MKASKEGWTVAGAAVAGLLASACCLGPVVAVVLGFGSAAFAVALEPYRPYLIALTLLLLGLAFYFVYRKPRAEACGPEGACRTAPRERTLKVLLWVVTAIVLASLTFPYYAPWIL